MSVLADGSWRRGGISSGRCLQLKIRVSIEEGRGQCEFYSCYSSQDYHNLALFIIRWLGKGGISMRDGFYIICATVEQVSFVTLYQKNCQCKDDLSMLIFDSQMHAAPEHHYGKKTRVWDLKDFSDKIHCRVSTQDTLGFNSKLLWSTRFPPSPPPPTIKRVSRDIFSKIIEFFKGNPHWNMKATVSETDPKGNTANQRVLYNLLRTRPSCGRMIWLLPTPFPSLSRQLLVFLSQSSCVSPVELTDGRRCAVSYDCEKA